MKIVFAHPHSHKHDETGGWMAECLEELGVEVIPYDEVERSHQIGEARMQEELKILIQKEHPDYLMIIKARNIWSLTLQKIKDIGIKIIYYHPDVRSDIEPFVLERGRIADWTFIMNTGSLQKYRDFGVNAFYLPEAAHERCHLSVELTEEEKELYGCDIVFIGSVRGKRTEMLDFLAQKGYNIKIWGNCPPTAPWKVRKAFMGRGVWQEEHSKACAGAKICITWDWDCSVENSWSARVYRVMATQCVYVAKHVKGMEEFFGDMPIAWFHDLDELNSQLRYLLDSDDVRGVKTAAARVFISRSHTFKHRMKEMLEVIQHA